jgi:hypothetical protein
MKSIIKNRFIILFLAFTAILFSTSCKKTQTCAEGYMGDSCTEQMTPKSIMIQKIGIENLVSSSGKIQLIIREYGQTEIIYDFTYDHQSGYFTDSDLGLLVQDIGSEKKLNVFIYNGNTATKKLLASGTITIYNSTDSFEKYKTANFGTVKFIANIFKYNF